jgi:serine phosphatase RsbU (regulator of sigma subunit)
VALEPGDLLVVYTDGLNETTDASDEELGHEAIERTVTALAARPLPEIRQAVFDLVEQHGEQTDDRRLLLVRFR